MADRYEYYNTGDDGYDAVRALQWRAQTFTPATAHKITSVKLRVYRTGLPGIITVGIRATDGSSHPTGEDLCSGTTDGDTLPEGDPYEWREITLGAGYDLEADTKYAIVVRAPSGEFNQQLNWRLDSTSPTYAGGCFEKSSDGGETWTATTGYDFMFEDWGEPAYTLHEKTVTDAIAFTDTLAKTTAKVLSDGIAFTDALWKVWVHGVLRVLRAVRNLPSIREEGPKR